MEEFYHGFKTGLGPFKHRHSGRTIPTGEDCAPVIDGRLVLQIRNIPLRTGHIYLPMETFNITTGVVEARMRFMGPRGGHAALWLQPEIPYLNEHAHEVDIVENFGNPNNAQQAIWAQTDTDPEPDKIFASSMRLDATKFHIYSVRMEFDRYEFFIDDYPVASTLAYGSSVPKGIILSYLISPFEQPRLLWDDLQKYKCYVDWVRARKES
jgi:hypothetical protein